MAKPTPGMGRGLNAILSISDGDPAARDTDLRALPVDIVVPNPRQPRRDFDQEALQTLAGSLGQQGLLQPILVRPLAGGTYELVAGERRWRAAKLAGLQTIPALVRDREDTAALEAALVENMARADLNPIEEARACAALIEELGVGRREIATRVGRSRSAVSNLVRLLDLPDEAIELLQHGALTEGHGRALLLADDHGARRSLARSAAEEGWSVRMTEERARQSSGRQERPASGRRRLAHPDQEAAADEIARVLSAAIGSEVRVRPVASGGYKAELGFSTSEEAQELARRLGLAALD